MGNQHTKNPLWSRPELVAMVHAGSAEGLSDQAIAHSVGVSNGTVSKIKAGQPVSAADLRAWRSSMHARLERLALKAAGLYESHLDAGSVRPDSLPLAIGILLSKRLELVAEAAQERPASEPEYDPADLLAELKRKVGPTLPAS